MKTIYIVSLSMGKDSLAMFLGLLEKQYPIDIVLFYDTGMEFHAIYQIRDRVKTLCRDLRIRFVELHPEEPFLYSMLERTVKNKDGSGYHHGYSWCGGPCRWATRHKIQAIHKFKRSLIDECVERYGFIPELVDYVGIAADEQHRLERKLADKHYPLVQWGWTEEFCLNYCWSQGWHWYEDSPVLPTGKIDLYKILDRVSCWCCANKNLRELSNIYRYLPQYWQLLCRLQQCTARPFKWYSKGRPIGIHELEQKFRQGDS